MTPAACPRHPLAAAHHGLCTACLLEVALAPGTDGSVEPLARFTIQLPLGARNGSSVFLVTGEWPWRGLLRLKTWSLPAPRDFVRRFAALRTMLEHLQEGSIVMPVTAWMDSDGRPCALTEFRHGVPLLDRVRSGKLPPNQARESLRILIESTVAAHAQGLVHGSIVAGNVLSGPDGAPFALDFGLAAVVAGGEVEVARAGSDLIGFERLEQLLREFENSSTRRSSL